MPRIKYVLAAMLFSLMLITGIGATVMSQNQPAGDITCGADVLFQWYIAERYFGFGAVQTVLARTAIDPSTVLDLNRFNRSQAGTLFESLNRSQDPQTGMLPGVVISQEFVNTALSMLLMDDAAFQNTLDRLRTAGADISASIQPQVPGEAPECARLRAMLLRYFAALAIYDLQTGYTLSFTPGQTAIPVPVSTEEAAPNPVSTEEVIVPAPVSTEEVAAPNPVSTEEASTVVNPPNPVTTEEASSRDDDDDNHGDDNSGSNSGRGNGRDDKNDDD